MVELVRYAQAGNLEAFETLVDRHAPELYRLAAAIVSEADAHDVVQDSFVAAWRELPRLRDANAFPAWMRRICINRCRNHLRSRNRSTVSIEELEGSSQPDRGADFRDQVHDRALIATYFARLNAEQRAVVVLHYGRGLTIAEAADALGVRVGTAKSRLNAALRVLRRAIPAPAPSSPANGPASDEVEAAG